MKFCDRPFKFMWVARRFDGSEQPMTVPCAWLNISGLEDTDLTKNSVEEIWNSETFEKVRESIKDGSFRYCNCVTCPFLANDSLPDLSEEQFKIVTVKKEIPSQFNLAFDRKCNHACPSCRHSIYKNTEKVQREVEIIGEKLLPYLNKADYINSNGQGDFFASKENLDIFRRLKPENPNFELSIETNGTLFDEKHWKQIEHLSQYEIFVNITPNSFERSTYAYLNGGFDLLEKLEENLHFVKKLREENKINRLNLIAVVQDTNVKEMPAFIDKCIDVYHADEVTVRPIYKWNYLTADEHWFKNVSNPLHPYHQYYLDMLNSDAMKRKEVYSWGCEVMQPQEHPAYVYRTMTDILSKIMMTSELEERLNRYFMDRQIEELYLYGTDSVGQAIESVFRRPSVHVRCKEVLCREKINTYESTEKDVILVTNFYNFEPIQRDFELREFKGKLIRLDDLIRDLSDGDNNE